MGSGWFGLVLGLMGIGVGMAFIDAPVAALLAGTLCTCVRERVVVLFSTVV
jgi:hypothetical protein